MLAGTGVVMCKYLGICSLNRKDITRREKLVRFGKASYWTPYRTVEQAIERAGLGENA